MGILDELMHSAHRYNSGAVGVMDVARVYFRMGK